MAIAAEKEDKNRKTVCVIGDGAITAGMAFEAMNHAGDVAPDMLVILNDNEMSISENVGALNNHLAHLLSGKLYTTLREGGKKVFSNMPPIKELLKKTEEHIKGMVVPGTMFEELGFNYIGPVDGHDVVALVQTLKNMRDLKGPQFLHIMTKKVVAMSLLKKIRSVGMLFLNLIQAHLPCLRVKRPVLHFLRFLGIGYAKKPKTMISSWLSHRLCVKGQEWCVFPKSTLTNTSMSPSPSNMPLPLPLA